MQIYLVGGAVRDKLMGKTPKDFDFTVVLNDYRGAVFVDGEVDLFRTMKAELERQGFKIFQENPEHFTIRAQFPVGSGGFLDGFKNVPGGEIKPGKKRLTADFVLARKEGPYTDGRRPDWVEAGTLEDDLARRDFTMNAIAQDKDGIFIDPYNGRDDIVLGRIKAVGDPKAKMLEDSLRILRALRFKITLGFQPNPALEGCMFDADILQALGHVSDERKMDELNKMLRHSSWVTIYWLNHYFDLSKVILAGSVNLEATMKQKGRGGRSAMSPKEES